MNRERQAARPGATPNFARKLVKFANIEVTPNPGGLAGRPRQAARALRPGALPLLGHAEAARTTRPTSPARSPRISSRRRAQLEEAVLHLVGARGAAPRGRRDDPDGPPGPRPAPGAALRGARAATYTLPRPPSFNEADISDKPSNMRDARAVAEPTPQIASSSSTTRGGSARCSPSTTTSKRLVQILTAHAPAEEHARSSSSPTTAGSRASTASRATSSCPTRSRCRVPLILRGPGVPAGQTVHGQVSNIDFAPTLVDVAKARAGRTMDGVSLMPTIRDPAQPPEPGDRDRGAARRSSSGNVPINAWDRPYKGVRTDRYTYVVYTETGDEELYDRQHGPVRAAQRRRRSRPTPRSRPSWRRSWPRSNRCAGAPAHVKP